MFKPRLSGGYGKKLLMYLLEVVSSFTKVVSSTHTHTHKIYKQNDFKQNAVTTGTEKFTCFLSLMNYLNVLKLFCVNQVSVFNGNVF